MCVPRQKCVENFFENFPENIDFHFHKHTEDVKHFFEDNPDRLLVYDISKDGPDNIINFFSDLNLDISKWGHYGKTSHKL